MKKNTSGINESFQRRLLLEFLANSLDQRLSSRKLPLSPNLISNDVRMAADDSDERVSIDMRKLLNGWFIKELLYRRDISSAFHGDVYSEKLGERQ